MPEDPRAATIRLLRTAEIWANRGEFARALEVADELDAARARLPSHDTLAVDAAHTLGNVHRELGRFGDARRHYEDALQGLEAAGEADSPSTAAVLSDFGILLLQSGAVGEAETVFRRAAEIDRGRLGTSHPSYARDLNNLAVLHDARGAFGRSVPMYEEVLATLRNAGASEEPEYATTLNNLAEVHRELGRFADARALHERALELDRRILGESHPGYAIDVNNLGIVLQFMGEHAEARARYEEAEAIWRRSLGDGHPQVAYALNNRADLCRALGRHDEAGDLLEEALDIRRRALGDAHPLVAATLGNVGELARERGDRSLAETRLREAIALQRDALGTEHPDLAKTLTLLALALAGDGRPDEALAACTEAAGIDDRAVTHAFVATSERQRMAYLDQLRAGFWIFLSLVRRDFPGSSEAVTRAFDLALRRKGLATEALALQRDAVLAGRYPELTGRLRELSELRMSIARASLAGGGPAAGELPRWKARKERLESELARRIPEMGLEEALAAADHRAVARALPPDAVLLEFVRFHPYDFDALPARGESPWEAPVYVCFVLRTSPAGEAPTLIDLGDATDIDRLIADARSDITGMDESRGGPPSDDAGRSRTPEADRAPGTESPRGAPVGGAPAATGADAPPEEPPERRLSLRLLAPLRPFLDGADEIVIAPDGDLNRLPFQILPDATGALLIDVARVSYVTVGRDILRLAKQRDEPDRTPGDSLVLADPDYDLVAEPGVGVESSGGTPVDAGRRSARFEEADLRFARLPGTRDEGERVGALLGVEPLLDAEALEARVKACRSPRILHLATHGFFFPDQLRDPGRTPIADGILGGAATRLAGLESPLLRSGLALAGVNTWLSDGTSPPEAEDGILTAEDVSGLDLIGTDLVVLSACDTGLGDLSTGEGVFGLRRSFVVAGARSLIMSLWPVPDRPTKELMEAFYERLLAGEGRAEALRQAQLGVRERYPHPAYWGAFICQGVAGPLPDAGSRPPLAAPERRGAS